MISREVKEVSIDNDLIAAIEAHIRERGGRDISPANWIELAAWKELAKQERAGR